MRNPYSTPLRCSSRPLGIAVVLLTLMLAFIMSAMAGEIADDPKVQIRSLLEKHFKSEFDEASSTLMEKALGKGTSKQQIEMALDGVRVILYNKAYIIYRCIITAQPKQDMDSLQQCERESVQEMQKYNSITTDYASIVLPRTAKCELKARLFDAEIEFPPYEFLKVSRGVGLMDFKVLNACLLSD